MPEVVNEELYVVGTDDPIEKNTLFNLCKEKL